MAWLSGRFFSVLLKGAAGRSCRRSRERLRAPPGAAVISVGEYSLWSAANGGNGGGSRSAAKERRVRSLCSAWLTCRVPGVERTVPRMNWWSWRVPVRKSRCLLSTVINIGRYRVLT